MTGEVRAALGAVVDGRTLSLDEARNLIGWMPRDGSRER